MHSSTLYRGTKARAEVIGGGEVFFVLSIFCIICILFMGTVSFYVAMGMSGWFRVLRSLILGCCERIPGRAFSKIQGGSLRQMSARSERGMGGS